MMNNKKKSSIQAVSNINSGSDLNNSLLSKLTEITTNQGTMIAKLEKLSKLDKLDQITSGGGGNPSALTSAVANKVGGKKGELIEFIGGPLKESFVSLKNSIIDLAAKAMTLSDVFATANSISSMGQIADMTHLDFKVFTQFINALMRDGSSEGGALSATRHFSTMNYGLTVDPNKLEMSDKNALDFFQKASPDLLKQTKTGDDGKERLINAVERFFMLQEAVSQSRKNIERDRETGKITNVDAEKKLQEIDQNISVLARGDAAVIASINNYKTAEEKAEIRKKLPQSEQKKNIDLRDEYHDEDQNADLVSKARPTADKTASGQQQLINTDKANKAQVVQKMEPTLSSVMAWINDRIRNNQDAIAEARKDAIYLQVVDSALSKIFDFFGKLANFLVQIGAFIKWLPKDPPDGPPDGSGGAPEVANDNVPQTLSKPANDNEPQTSPPSESANKKHYIPSFGTVYAAQNMGIMGGARFLGQDRIQHETRNLPKEEQEAKMKEFNDEFNKAEAQLNKINQDLMIIGGTVALTALTRGAAGKYLEPMLAARTAALMANIGKITATGGAVGATMVAGVATTPEAKANSLVMVQPDKLPAGVNSQPFAKSMVMLNKGDASGQNHGHYNPIAAGAGAMQTSQNKQYQQMTQNITNNNQQFHANITVNSTSVDHRVLAQEIQQVLKNQWGGEATNVSKATTQLTKI